MTYVKIDMHSWARELGEHLDETLDGEDSPAAHLSEIYTEWAAKHYAKKSVPAAVDMAACYRDEGKFITREDGMSDKTWKKHCQAAGCLFWDDKYACVSDGFYSNA
jgi:hypothetical protein